MGDAGGRGTLFLDEIGDLSLEAQVYLLRLLEEREVYPVGATRPVAVNVRIIAATHKNLQDEVRRGRFREDLYYRLKVVHLKVPPLRKRPSDIPLLVDHFLRTSRHGGPGTTISKDAFDMLMHYPWPGNVRQLKHGVEQALLASVNGAITVNTCPKRFVVFRRPGGAGRQKPRNRICFLDIRTRYAVPLDAPSIKRR